MILLNASVENTRIYKGNAAFTSIENGTEYGLVPYNMNGEIEGFQDEEITLIYPAALNGLMTIAGMAFNLPFARLSMMYDGDADRVEELKVQDAEGFVMSFSLDKLSEFDIKEKYQGKIDKVNQNVFANDGAKADTLRNAYKKTYKPTGSSSGSLTKNNKKTKVANSKYQKKGRRWRYIAKVKRKMVSTA